MRKVLISLGLAGVALAAVPAAAQGYGYNNGGYDRGYGNGSGQYRDGARQELWQLSQRVDRGIQRGDLNRREAEYFRREIQQLRYLDQRFSYGGYDWRERQQLDQRIDRLRQQLRYERNDGDRRWGNDRRW
jgi:hypothetical protein